MDPHKQASEIYDLIRTTSGDRPFAFQSVEQMNRELTAWRRENVALAKMRAADNETQLAFLSESVGWLKAESREHANFRVVATLIDATLRAIHTTKKPLPSDLVLKLLRELREQMMVRFYFPFDALLGEITCEQVNEEIRAELRKLHLQYAPSAAGKIDERTAKTRNRLAELMRVEGEPELERGRGPWTQIVFRDIAARDPIACAGWEALLEHCAALEQTVPGAKWTKRANELIAALGETRVQAQLCSWLVLGPTPGQPAEARSPIEDSACQKGVVWALALSNSRDAAGAIGDFAVACLRKIPMLGAISQKVGFACVQALGSMETNDAIAQLARLRARVKYAVALRLIEKCLREAATQRGMGVEDLEDLAAPTHGLDANGQMEIAFGEAKAKIAITGRCEVAVEWRDANGKVVKSTPASLKKTHAAELKSVAKTVQALEQDLLAQRYRTESFFASARKFEFARWRAHYIEHPLLGAIGRKLIWVFSDEEGWEEAALYDDGTFSDAHGKAVDASRAKSVRLWHPLSSEADDVERWRERMFGAAIRQPIAQAFREFYEVTNADRETKTYSNRFAGVLIRQHQFASLCRERGWKYKLMGAGFDGSNVPSKEFPAWKLHAEFYVDLPLDRKPGLKDSALNEQSGAGINVFLGSDQVRFYRERKEIAIEDVPAIVYSEAMRDVDLFTSVCAVGADETWADQGDRGVGSLAEPGAGSQLSAIVAVRADVLGRVLPLTPIAARCNLEKAWLEVRGQLGTYRISLIWGGVMQITDSRTKMLHIPQKVLDRVPLDFDAFPITIDHRTETTLRKAYVLAHDDEIRSPEMIEQLM